MSAPRRDAGFTLVEVLIAMFIFALISAGTMTALTSTLRGKAQMNEWLDDISRIDSARALMRSDFSNLWLLPVRDAYGSNELYVMSGGVDNLIEFTRAGRSNPGGLDARSEFQRVSYVFENGDLIRRSLVHDNPAPQTRAIDRVLLSGLEAVSVRFHLRVGGTDQPSNSRQPDLVQDYILVEAGQTQTLPYIVSVDAAFKNGDRLVQHFELSL